MTSRVWYLAKVLQIFEKLAQVLPVFFIFFGIVYSEGEFALTFVNKGVIDYQRLGYQQKQYKSGNIQFYHLTHCK